MRKRKFQYRTFHFSAEQSKIEKKKRKEGAYKYKSDKSEYYDRIFHYGMLRVQ